MRWPKLRTLADLNPIPEKVKPQIKIEPDPNMAPGEWEWSCKDCDAGETGPDQEIRAQSMRHCLRTGHAVTGSAL